MAKKTDTPYVHGIRGTFPLPEFYGFSGRFWNKVSKYAWEQDDLRQRHAERVARINELHEELAYQQTAYSEAMIRAARFNDPEPSRVEIERVEKVIAREMDKANALHRAADIAREDYERFMESAPDEVFEQLKNITIEAMAEYEELVARALKLRDRAGIAYGTYHRLHPLTDDTPKGIGEPPPDPTGKPWHDPEYRQPLYQPFKWHDEDGVESAEPSDEFGSMPVVHSG